VHKDGDRIRCARRRQARPGQRGPRPVHPPPPRTKPTTAGACCALPTARPRCNALDGTPAD
jgi:hypothetical protein